MTPEEKVSAERFGINVLFDLRKLGLEFFTNDVVTTRTFVKQEPEATRGFVKGLVEGIHYYKTHKKESIEIMAKYMRTTDRKIIEAYDFNSAEYGQKPYPSLKAGQLSLEEIARRNPKAKDARADQFFVQALSTRSTKEVTSRNCINSDRRCLLWRSSPDGSLQIPCFPSQVSTAV